MKQDITYNMIKVNNIHFGTKIKTICNKFTLNIKAKTDGFVHCYYKEDIE